MPAFASIVWAKAISTISFAICKACAGSIRRFGNKERVMRPTIARLTWIVLLARVRRCRRARRAADTAAAAGDGAGDRRRPETRWRALADIRRQLRQSTPQPAHAAHACQRQPADAAMDISDRHAGQFRNDHAPARQHPVRDGTPERRLGARRAHGTPIWRYRRELPVRT